MLTRTILDRGPGGRRRTTDGRPCLTKSVWSGRALDGFLSSVEAEQATIRESGRGAFAWLGRADGSETANKWMFLDPDHVARRGSSLKIPQVNCDFAFRVFCVDLKEG